MKKRMKLLILVMYFFPLIFSLFARFCALKMYAFITRELKAVAFCKAQ